MSAGKADMRSQYQRFTGVDHLESFNDIACGSNEFEEYVPWRGGQTLNAYLRNELSFDLHFIVGDILESEPQKFKLSFEKVDLHGVSKGDPPRLGQFDISSDTQRTGRSDVQPSVPILVGESIEHFDCSRQMSLKRIGQFFNVVRLYRLKPDLEFIREWVGVEGTIFEAFGGGTNGKIQMAFLGGRMGSAQESSKFISRTIQCRAQLIEHLAKFSEREIPFPSGLEKVALTTATPSRSTLVSMVQVLSTKSPFQRSAAACP